MIITNNLPYPENMGWKPVGKAYDKECFVLSPNGTKIACTWEQKVTKDGKVGVQRGF